MVAHKGGDWPYHESRNGNMVACDSNPCKIHGGSDIMAKSPEEAGNIMERVLDAADHWDISSSQVIPFDMDIPHEALAVINGIDDGEALVVGGGVRDAFFGMPNKDIDLEIHGSGLDDIMHSLRRHGIHVDAVGKSFGVLTARDPSWDMGVDIATPRKERKIGEGHTGFVAEQDPYMGVSQAASRRDFTFNALMYDPHRHVILDPYHGVDDIRHHVMRATSSRFAEDPLRVLRGMQFASRFGLDMDDKTAGMCRGLHDEYHTLSKERIRMEWHKMYSRGLHPIQGFTTLRKSGWDDTVPGLHKALSNPLFMQRVNRVWKYDDESMKAAVVAYMVPQDERRAMLRETLIGDDNVKRSMQFVSSLDADLHDAAHRREWEYRNRRKGVSLHDVSRFAKVVGREDIAAQAELDNGYIEPWIRGDDIMKAVPDRAPGRWMSATLDDMRRLQYEDRFSTREEAMKSIAEISSRHE